MVSELNYRNLDNEPDFAGHQHLDRVPGQGHRRPPRRPDRTKGALGEDARGLAGITVTLHESHIAWASYERAL